MKKIIATINPFLSSLKYFLLTILLIFAAMTFAQYILENHGFNASLSDLKQTLLPFVVAAAVSMFIAQKTAPRRN